LNDLLGVIAPENWKMEDAARQPFNETLAKARAEAKAVFDASTSLLEHPDDLAAGEGTYDAVQEVLPLIDAVAETVTQFQGASWGQQFRDSRRVFQSRLQPLEAYVSALRAGPPAERNAKPAASASPPPVPQTEKVEVPKFYEAPPATLTSETGTLQPAEVKLLLYHAYAAAFRFTDLLSQLDPGKWKMDDAARPRFDQVLAGVRRELKGFEEWRGQFAEQPDNLYLGYKTYTAMSSVITAMAELADAVSRYQGPASGSLFQQAADPFAATRKSLDSYLSYLLQNQQRMRSTLENNLAGCQNNLTYTMFGKTGPVTDVKNIKPVFKGHPRNGHAAGKGGQAGEEKKAEGKAPGKKTGKGKQVAQAKPAEKPAKAGSESTSGKKSTRRPASGNKRSLPNPAATAKPGESH
jgi:hypothetical protein